MKSQRWASLEPLALAVCLLCCSGVTGQSVSGPAKELTKEQVSARLPAISGHVYRADTGAPLAKAVVTLNTTWAISNGRYPRAVTEDDGSYRFYDVQPNTYHAFAACEGFVKQDYSRDGTLEGKFLIVNSENPLQNIDFHLARAGIISGSVVDERDKAVPQIEVSAVRLVFSPGGLESPHRVQATETDEGGSFRLKGLEPGSYYVCVNGPNGKVLGNRTRGESYRETYYGNATSPAGAQLVRVVAGDETKDTRITVPAEKRYNITVRVSGPGQDGVPSRYSYQVFLEGRNQSSSTRGDGSITIPDIPPGDYTLVSTAWEVSTYVGQSSTAVHVVDADVQINVQVGGLGEVSGKAVLIGSETPSFAGIRLFMRSQEALNPSGFDASGRFFVTRVLPGHYTFELAGPAQPVYMKQIRCSGRDYTWQPITIESGQVLRDCEVALADDTGVVQGRVIAEASDLVVVLIPESIELRKVARYTLIAKTSPDGSFALPNVIPGDYLLFAVPQADDHYYFAMDFADRNRRAARRVSVKPRQRQGVELNPLPGRVSNNPTLKLQAKILDRYFAF